jgi:hypothetical protein
MRRWILRSLFCLLSGLLAGVLLLFGSIRLDQYTLRLRAERLLRDIRSLELRKSTYADARRVIDDWSDNAHENGPCRTDWCDIEISFTDFAWKHSDFIFQNTARVRISLWLGARPASVRASISVREGVVIGKSIGAVVGGPCHDFDNQPLCLAVIGQAETGRHRFIDPRHPEYSFHKPDGCEFCVDAHVIFSPYAKPEDVRRLTDVNFACITRWTPCETETDILPTAWKQRQSEEVLPTSAVNNCSEVVRAQSRELGFLPLATVILVTDIGEGPQIMVRWDEQHNMRRQERQPNTFPAPNNLRFQKGDRLLVFEQYEYRPSNSCAVIPATEENVRIARQGLSEALSDRVDTLNLPFGRIHPPQIKIQ